MGMQQVIQMVVEMQMPLGEGSVVEPKDDTRRQRNTRPHHHPSLHQDW